MSEPLDVPPADPAEFLDQAERSLLELSIQANRADWIYCTFITPDTEELTSLAAARLMTAATDLAKRSSALRGRTRSPVDARKLELLRRSFTLIAPSGAGEAEELSRLSSAMQALYARGRYQPRGSPAPLDVQGLSRILETSRDPASLEEAWSGWHAIARPMRSDFTRYVELANRGARELDYPDLGALWRAKYDMPADDFAREAGRLWDQVRPLYRSLHAYVRRRLGARYGPELVPDTGPIPAFLLGNMWAQSWAGIYPLLAPDTEGPSWDLGAVLRERKTTPQELVRYGERFFLSLGFEPLPATFWERSMFVRPPGRDVVCHASAWDIDYADDLRLKMCLEISEEDFFVVHHELGHNFYQRAYARQPFLFRESAHDGFHEAIGDTIALSVTPEYLTAIGLLDATSGPTDDIPYLLRRALAKLAFLPFGLVVDEWRWRVFSGDVGPERYNRTWWEMRTERQGIAPPPGRSEADFDPGAKFHVASGTPYMRYFLAHILEFQLHRALARAAGSSGPLHRATIHGSRAAGERLRSMLELGSRREWPDALEAATGERRMDAAALLEYFAPLQRWLDHENQGAPVGW